MDLTHRIQDVQNYRFANDSSRLQDLERYLQMELNVTLDQEESLWFQKSRHNWIVDGKIDQVPGLEEISKISCEMGSFKAPGDDGFPTIFFQRQWPFLRTQICDVIIYKILSKIIVDRLKPVMELIISPFLVIFVPNRQIQDNIIIVQELIHYMHKMKGRKTFMAIKIDLIKAYDRNGGKTEDFTLSRGIRQGDPLSPYLFVMAIEKLTYIINTAVSGGEKLSVEKTSVFFSRNMPEDMHQRISEKSGFKYVKIVGRYLGTMMQHGRVSKNSYSGIVDKIRAKLNAWNQQSLSQAGRITLAQYVMSVVPYFQMQSCKIPSSICLEIEKVQRDWLIWEVGDGKSISFWYDRWFPQASRLQECATRSISSREADVKVAGMVKHNGEWDLASMSEFLPADIVDSFRSVLPPSDADGSD
ncbi:uncharacterized protein LOC133295655 [Gastrolobium bilobum]|uniref:uncharacterized protein LOC133295655 n=1 Tax=Gastrolobium bilobum TaxID=150636 RepID=UPI002AB1CECA|nr:uncharacterized protein LOC133295655 [Gastrolobium bilobum]